MGRIVRVFVRVRREDPDRQLARVAEHREEGQDEDE